MAPNDASRYAEVMTNHPYGHALFVPESSKALLPSACGYLDRLGRWAPIAYIDDPASLTAAGLTTPSALTPRTPQAHTWGPKKSTLVSIRKLDLTSKPGIEAAIFPASVKLALEFSSGSEFSAILHCSEPVTHRGYYHRSPFKKWAEDSAQKLLDLVPDVKEHGFWMVTDTYSTSDVRINAWREKGQRVQMGFKIHVLPAGEIGPSGDFVEGFTSGGWQRTKANVSRH